ncbi:hypothetical protein [Nocardiopsis potens]|uniref:hypothetical protein n=1 Tax=Nocardiopsis potens TaxID=1246458 RepID=UPI000344CED6|nr:hypothetical protein [Nocardiopsis potens]
MDLRDQNSPPRRFASPGVLGFVLLCFFLPFVGVSCESSMGSIEVQASGWDMAVGGEPSITGTGVFAEGTETDASQMTTEDLESETGEPIETFSPLMLLSVVAITAGIIVGSIPAKPFVRAVGVLSASGLGLLLSLVNISLALAGGTEESSYGVVVSAGTRAGFWITTLLLMAVVGFAVFEMVASRRPAPVVPGGPVGPGGPAGPGGPFPPPGQVPPGQAPPPAGPYRAGPPTGPMPPQHPPVPQRPPMPQAPPPQGGPAAPAPPPWAAPPNAPRFLPPGRQEQ